MSVYELTNESLRKSVTRKRSRPLRFVRCIGEVLIGSGILLIALFLCMLDSTDMAFPLKVLAIGLTLTLVGVVVYFTTTIKIRVIVERRRV